MPVHGQESNQVEVINISDQPMRFNLDGMIYVLEPLERAKVHSSYTKNRQMQPKRDPVKPILELMTNGKVLPVTDPRAKEAVAASEG